MYVMSYVCGIHVEHLHESFSCLYLHWCQPLAVHKRGAGEALCSNGRSGGKKRKGKAPAPAPANRGEGYIKLPRQYAGVHMSSLPRIIPHNRRIMKMYIMCVFYFFGPSEQAMLNRSAFGLIWFRLLPDRSTCEGLQCQCGYFSRHTYHNIYSTFKIMHYRGISICGRPCLLLLKEHSYPVYYIILYPTHASVYILVF